MPFFCAVPPGLPADPEGRAVFAAAGPYVVSEFIRGRRAVLRRNPFYRGGRPHHVDRFIVDMQAASFGQVLDQVERNQADWGMGALALLPRPRARAGEKVWSQPLAVLPRTRLDARRAISSTAAGRCSRTTRD